MSELSGVEIPVNAFDPASVKVFRYLSWEWEPSSGAVQLRYGFDDSHVFVETISLPPAAGLDGEQEQAIRRAVRLLWLLSGVSYYKAAAPYEVSIDGGISASEHDFLAEYYLHGLGEYAVVNSLDMTARPVWPAPSLIDAPITVTSLTQRPLVAVGGGKDSVVSVETLRRGGLDPLQFTVNTHPITSAVMAVSGLDVVHAHRSLDSSLLALNETGALNGHVPVTAIVSLIAVSTALIVGVDTVVMSNERSASEGNTTWHGREVNHQHSKSLDFERGLADLVRSTVTPSLRYFSLLRALSELHIAKLVAGLTEYHSTFTSCNKAFRLDPTMRTPRWCGNCDKCRFVSLALAPWLSRDEVTAIIGSDIFDHVEQAPGMRALLGIEAEKPFECVGEIAECRAMLLLAASRPEWAEAPLIALLEPEIRAAGAPSDDDVDALLRPSTEHLIPENFPRPETVLG